MEYIILLLLLGLILVTISVFVTEADSSDKIPVFFIGITMFGFSLFYLAFTKGEEHGAYNQLRGKYEVTYVIDKDSCVVDTIIKFN